MTTVVMANGGETFPAEAQREGVLWQKALLAAGDEDVFLISPGDTPNVKPPLEGAWKEPLGCVSPRPLRDGLCRDLLRDEVAWQRLIAVAGDQVSLTFQVFSSGLQRVVERLRTEGIRVDGQLPSCSPATVAFWNTKVGAHGLLAGIPEIAAARPAATVCTYENAVAVAAGAGDSQSFVLKPNYGLGGVGIEVLSPTGKWRPSGTAVKAAIAHGDGTEPYLLETLVGNLGSNRSLTADFMVQRDGDVRFLGVGEQLLTDGIAYGGCQSGPSLIEPQAQERVRHLGRLIGITLRRRGYAGLVNVDFILTSDMEVYVSELNLRQSAPLDQFLVCRRLHGDDWATLCSFRCEEYLPASPSWTGLDELVEFAEAVVGDGDGVRILPLTLQVDASGRARAAYAALAPELAAAEKALDMLRGEAQRRWP